MLLLWLSGVEGIAHPHTPARTLWSDALLPRFLPVKTSGHWLAFTFPSIGGLGIRVWRRFLHAGRFGRKKGNLELWEALCSRTLTGCWERSLQEAQEGRRTTSQILVTRQSQSCGHLPCPGALASDLFPWPERTPKLQGLSTTMVRLLAWGLGSFAKV
jgi:hypothetical protein